MTRRRKVQRGRIASQSRSKSTGRTKATNSRLQLYVDDAATDLQPLITDMIPRRKYGLFIWLICGLIVISLVQALYVWRESYFPDYALPLTTWMELAGTGTLTSWLSTMLLAFNAWMAMMIFSVRRHKLDDYRGTYGLWLYVAVFCGLASLDVVIGLHRSFHAGMMFLTNKPIFGDGAIWWVGAAGVVACLLALRVMIDVWRSRAAVLFLLLAVASYTAAAMFYLHLWKFGPIQVDMMTNVALTMLGHVLVGYSMLVYARYVFREATGELKKKQRKKKSAKAKSSRTGGRWTFGLGKSKSKSKTRSKPADEEEEVEEEEAEEEEYEYEVEYEEVEDLDELERLTAPEESSGRKSRKKQRRQNRRAA
ncbi:MAG: hypothetical protein AAF497_25245 [Planctomycetota bacterium]